MKALAAQPTVSPTLIHHIQRGHIQIKSNVKAIAGSEVTFENGEKESFDSIIMCTGYKIGLSMLHPDLKKLVFKDNKESILNVKPNFTTVYKAFLLCLKLFFFYSCTSKCFIQNLAIL